MAYIIIRLCIIAFSKTCLVSGSLEFQPYVPFIHESNCLINIVVSSFLQRIPFQNKNLMINVLHTYTIHNVASLNLDISDNYIEEHNSIISRKTGYFRLFSRYRKGPIAFLLLTNDNILQALYFIQKSGFQTSLQVLFFINLSTLSYQNLLITTQFLKSLLSYNVQPFHSNIVFYNQFEEKIKYILCYFCDSVFVQLIPFKRHSFEAIRQSALLLNSNGQGRIVSISLPFKYVIYLTCSKYLPEKSCFQGFSDYKFSLKSLFQSLSSCDRKLVLAISSIQITLNITLRVFGSNNQPENKWHLQFWLTFIVFGAVS